MRCRVGDIVHVSDLPIYPKKGKYAVCICLNPGQFLLINSENRALYDCIPLATKAGRSFPKYDSFIGCKQIFTAASAQIDSHHGALDADELALLAEKIDQSRFLSPREKVPVLAAIRAQIEALKAPTPPAQPVA